jgi:hypothetical protein
MQPYTIPNNFGRLVRAIADEKARRLAAHTNIKVITLEPDEHNDLTIPGTCTVFLGLARQPNFEALFRGFMTRDTEVIDAATSLLRANTNEDENVPPVDALIAILEEATSIVDLRYETTALLSAVPMSAERNIAVFPVPYNGGRLEESKFIMSSFSPDQAENVSGFIVLHKPRLTDLERHIVDLIPADASDFHLGVGRPIPANCTPAALVVFVIAATLMHTPFIGRRPQVLELRARLQSAKLSDERINELGDLSSAEELLELRRKALWGR